MRASAHERDNTWKLLDEVAALANASNIDGVRIMGPVRAPMERLAGRYRGQLLLQSRSRQSLHRLIDLLRHDLESRVSARRVRWSIDVDPIELF
jgi:primosomal protein N' (replication factor Y)